MTDTPVAPGWTAGLLGDIADVTMGQSPQGSSYNKKRVGAPLINGPAEFTDHYPVVKQWTTAPTRFCKPGDLLICVRGSSTGRMNVADSDYCIGRGVAAVCARSPNHQGFVRYALASVVEQLLKLQSGSTFPSIDARVIRSGKIAIPTPQEQCAIAEALTDVDNTIASLTRLVAKKEAIKLGLVQQLQSGNTRMSGFTKAWSTHKLAQLGTFLRGRGIKRDDVRTSGVACIRYGELYTAYRGYTSTTLSFVPPDVAATALPLQRGDLLFAGSGETRDEIGTCVAFTGSQRAVAGGDIIVLRAPSVNPIFLSMLTNTPRVAEQKARLGQGDAVVHIGSGGLGSIEVDLPPRDEQDAIAQVLVDADHEILQLEGIRAKVQCVRQGMMQGLLTGRTRLPLGEAVAA